MSRLPGDRHLRDKLDRLQVRDDSCFDFVAQKAILAGAHRRRRKRTKRSTDDDCDALCRCLCTESAWGVCASRVILALTVNFLNWKGWLADSNSLTFTAELEDALRGGVWQQRNSSSGGIFAWTTKRLG